MHFHKWSKWEEIDVTVHDYRLGEIDVTRQRRVCEVCGRIQVARV